MRFNKSDALPLVYFIAVQYVKLLHTPFGVLNNACRKTQIIVI